MQEERRVPDILYSVIISVVLLLALLTHLPSLILIIRDFKRPNNVNLIYRNLFLVDTVLMLVYIPMDIIWTQTRQNQFLCQFKQANLFLVFFAGCNFLITLAVDRWGDSENCTFRNKKIIFKRYIAIFFPMKHLTIQYRKYLTISIIANWMFSIMMGLWQGWVHQVGPSVRISDPQVCTNFQNLAILGFLY